MKFDQLNLDEFMDLIRCDVKLTLGDFCKLMNDVCILELGITSVELFNRAQDAKFFASPTKQGKLVVATKDGIYSFEVKYNDENITNIKLKENDNGEK